MLWPYLFEFVADFHFTNALGVVVRSLAILAQNKIVKESDELSPTVMMINFEAAG